MDDATFKGWQERIAPRVAYWVGVLGLGDWDWCVEYDRENNVPPLTFEAPTGRLTASINASWPYRSLAISFYCTGLQALADTGGMTDRDLDEVIVHELMHAPLDQLRGVVPAKRLEQWYPHEEHVGSLLAAAFARMEDRHRVSRVYYDDRFATTTTYAAAADKRARKLKRRLRRLNRAMAEAAKRDLVVEHVGDVGTWQPSTAGLLFDEPALDAPQPGALLAVDVQVITSHAPNDDHDWYASLEMHPRGVTLATTLHVRGRGAPLFHVGDVWELALTPVPREGDISRPQETEDA